MASAGEDEKLNSEIPERRTRSGRKVMPVVPAVSTRSRRTKKDSIQEAQLSMPSDNIIDEELVETVAKQPKQKFEQTLEQSEDLLTDIMNVVDTKEDVANSESEKNDLEYVEEGDPVGVQTESVEYVEEIVEYNNDGKDYTTYQEQELPEGEEDVEMYDEEQNNAEVPTAAEAGIDDKSSSFPFGTAAGQSESSGEAQNEEDTSGEKSAVDGSLLASLAGDNANSLPSVGGGEELDVKKDDFITNTKDVGGTESVSSNRIKSSESEDSFSEPAIAESLNDVTDASNATIVHTEMVSEDELPLATKPEINDAEEVSDDELPAPKRAELPADAEVISEDELPPNAEKKSPKHVSNNENDAGSGKKKRKADDLNNGDDVGDDKETKAKQNSNEVTKSANENEEYNPMSPTSESDDSAPLEKKPKLGNETVEKPENEKETANQKHSEKDKEKKDEKPEKKRLPDLEKYWRPVKEDPADFTGWTYLLQYVDNESDAEAAREAYDAFLSQYPYCYGYWRKYADFEKRKGIKANCNVVFKRGLEAIPLSVDLWIHYLTHIKATQPDDEIIIREQFERAIDACGLEFRSDKLWDAYIKWENDAKRYDRVLQIYDRLLSIPTQGYSGHFDNFQDLVNQHPLSSLLSDDELAKLRLEVRELKKLANSHSNSKDKEEATKEDANTSQTTLTTIEISEKPVDESDSAVDKSEKNEEKMDEDAVEPKEKEEAIEANSNILTEEETAAVKSRLISIRRKEHKNTVAAVTARWTFEEGIKRPYFHVKPLERCQLKNWKDYLDFEIELGDRRRILVLFERCLIACALYDEFWLKMLRYLESETELPDNEKITRDVFRRACEIHHPDKPSLHLMWSAFEECQTNFDTAATILMNLERKCPNLLQVAYRRINVERRRGDLTKCRELYEHYITNAKNKTIAGSLAIKYARFLNKICNDLEGGIAVLRKALDKDAANTRVALQMIDLALQRSSVNEDEIVSIMEHFMERDGMDPEQKVLFAQRKVEFLEDFGSTAKGLQDAQRALQLALSKASDAKKKRESSPSRKSGGNSSSATATAASQLASSGYNNSLGSTTAASSGYGNYANSTNSAYYGQGSNSSGYQQQQTQQQQSYDNYYNQWQYGSNYSGYGQWSGYGNYY